MLTELFPHILSVLFSLASLLCLQPEPSLFSFVRGRTRGSLTSFYFCLLVNFSWRRATRYIRMQRWMRASQGLSLQLISSGVLTYIVLLYLTLGDIMNLPLPLNKKRIKCQAIVQIESSGIFPSYTTVTLTTSYLIKNNAYFLSVYNYVCRRSELLLSRTLQQLKAVVHSPASLFSLY